MKWQSGVKTDIPFPLRSCGSWHYVKSARIRSYSGPDFSRFFPHLNWIRRDYSVRIRENAGKMRTRITPNTDSFHAGWVKENTVKKYILRRIKNTLSLIVSNEGFFTPLFYEKDFLKQNNQMKLRRTKHHYKWSHHY